MQGCRPRRPGRCPDPARAWGRVRPHARRYRGSLAYPWPRVVGAVLVGPTLAASVSVRLSPDYAATRARLAVRVAGLVSSVLSYPHPPRQRSCHGGCYAAPLRSTPSASSRETRRHFVPSRSLLGRSRRSAPLRGRRCHRSGP